MSDRVFRRGPVRPILQRLDQRWPNWPRPAILRGDAGERMGVPIGRSALAQLGLTDTDLRWLDLPRRVRPPAPAR